MDELIKRSDAIDALNECEDIKGYSYRQMHDALMEIPSADRPTAVDLSSVYSTAYKSGYEKGKADRPQGKWIEQEDCWQCSVCGDEYVLEVGVKPIDAKMNFCPNCGSRNRKENE